MENKSLKIPVLILVIGLILSLAVATLTCIVKEPVITTHDFTHSATYVLEGETKTLEGVYRVTFSSTGGGIDPMERYYRGEYLNNPSEEHSAAYTIAEKDGLDLCIVTIFSDDYLMGDTQGVPEATFLYDPYLAIYDQEGYEYDISEKPDVFDVELIDWEQPVPVENSFRFVGFSYLHTVSMFAMLIVGLLVIVACMIFVKRDKSVPYKVLDKISIVLNFLCGIMALPIITLVAWLSQIFASGDELSYQFNLCVPVITAFALAASIALRRKNYTKAGFFVQFTGPVLFVLVLILETLGM